MAAANIVLTGFMATGKSTVGRLLAARLGYEWVDTDALIEAEHGPIAEIFRSDGEEAFRDLERVAAADLADRDGLVVSTGGRMMLDPENAATLGASSHVFCLTAEPSEILRRVEAQQGIDRPLLDTASPAERIAELLDERAAAYARYEAVPTDGRSFDQIVSDIIERIRR